VTLLLTSLSPPVCLFSSEVIHTLVQEGHPAAPGACGENITLQGLAWSQVAGSGAVLAIGCTAVLQMTEWTTPCESIKGAFTKGAFSRICPKRNPGCSRWYAKVVASGWVHPGDEVRVLRMPDAST
jgi:MOSC domain-containing protein YiiM